MEFLVSIFKPLLLWLLNFIQARIGLDRDHDVAIFRKIDAIGSECRISDILNSHVYNKRIRINDNRTLDDLVDALLHIENKFLDRTLQRKAEQMRKEMSDLLGLVHSTFFSTRGEWLKFYPDPIGKDHYDRQWTQLNKKIDTSWEAYKTFRLAVKQRLRI